MNRCFWAEGGDALMQAYHDTEWGVPCHDARALFELLTLEGAQAGLSWRTVLVRRVAGMSDEALEGLLVAGSGLIRNRLKIFSVRDNARAALALPEGLGRYVWSFVGGVPVRNRPADRAGVPATSAVSDALSRGLKKAGFRFVGSTICYAFMQASGMVDDHVRGCFRCVEE